MKTFLFISCLLFICSFSGFSETKKTIDKKNEYGGKSIQINYEAKDKNVERLEASIYYYNKSGERQKIVHKHNSRYQKESGYIQQEQHYRNNKIYSYIMILTEAESEKIGYQSRIEYVDDVDNIVRYTYCTDSHKFTEVVDESFDDSKIMTIKALNTHIHEDYKKNLTGNSYIYHADPFIVRSIISFSTDPVTVTIEDNEIITSYFESFSIEEYMSLYLHKVVIDENGNKVIAYIQKSLIEYVRKGEFALIKYGYMGLNEGIVLFIIGFIDPIK